MKNTGVDDSNARRKNKAGSESIQLNATNVAKQTFKKEQRETKATVIHQSGNQRERTRAKVRVRVRERAFTQLCDIGAVEAVDAVDAHHTALHTPDARRVSERVQSLAAIAGGRHIDKVRGAAVEEERGKRDRDWSVERAGFWVCV